MQINKDNAHVRRIMKNKSLSIVVVAAIAVMLIATAAVATEDAFAGKKKHYEKNQATSQANACGNGELPLNVGCQNVDSQIQGDENVVAQTAQQTFP
jgi:hypothetical protein